MNPAFFQHIENVLHTERIHAYRQDGTDHTVTLALDVMGEYDVFLKAEEGEIGYEG